MAEVPPENTNGELAGHPDPEALYRAAHRAHFVDRNYAEATAAWDRYLAAAPNGNLAVEARYNRAIGLVRLGRHADAREALRPFAEGFYGPYRQEEARRILDSIQAR